nr:hypothetical protein [Tanacetum cinerariifolium]
MIKKEKSEKLGRVQTEMEIILEHTEQGISHELSMEILLESTSNKLMVGHKNYSVSDLLIDFQIKFSLSIGEIVTHWFTLIVLSALRRSGNENMLSLAILILRSILTDLQAGVRSYDPARIKGIYPGTFH